MAYLLTSDELQVGEGPALPRSDVVILGGDEVYPVANKGAYYRRLSAPFEQAAIDLRAAKRATAGKGSLAFEDLYMIPGNHDWYDGLGSMSRRYFSYHSPGEVNAFGRERKHRRLGQFKTFQARSYFVLVLPHDWEIWAVDVQLGEDIDPDQFSFFSWRKESLTERSKVVLCSAVPTIVYGEERDRDSLTFGLDRIGGLVKGRGARVCAQFAGDVHNYQRYEKSKKSKDGFQYTRQYVVCGGGGAFLHPTHAFRQGVEPAARFPSRERSKAISRRILLFPFKHVGMCVFIGLLYLLMFWHGPPSLDLAALAAFPVDHPGSIVLALAALLGCAFFAEGKPIWGGLHGAAHIAAAVLGWKAGTAAVGWLAGSLPQLQAFEPVLGRLLTFLAGGALGGTLFGLYLQSSLNWLGLHHNEAFSSLSWPHEKAFLRCRVEGDGSLTVSVIGVERTAGETGAHPVETRLVDRFTLGG